MKNLTSEEKRKLRAKIAQEQERRIKQAEAKGQKYQAARLRADRLHPKGAKPPARRLSAEGRRSLQTKILEHERKQFEGKSRQTEKYWGFLDHLLPKQNAEKPGKDSRSDTGFWWELAARKAIKRLLIIMFIDMGVLAFILWDYQATGALSPRIALLSGGIAFLIACVGLRTLYLRVKDQVMGISWTRAFGIPYGIALLTTIGMLAYSCVYWASSWKEAVLVDTHVIDRRLGVSSYRDDDIAWYSYIAEVQKQGGKVKRYRISPSEYAVLQRLSGKAVIKRAGSFRIEPSHP